jgi:hypothetical protein
MMSFWLPESSVTATIFLALANYAAGLNEIIVGAFIVEAARLDLRDGSHDLISLSWMIFAFGGTIGSLFAAYEETLKQPHKVFIFSSFMGILTFICGFLIDKDRYTRSQDFVRRLSIWQHLKLKLHLFWRTCKHPIMFPFYTYLIVSSLTPTFGDLDYYFL